MDRTLRHLVCIAASALLVSPAMAQDWAPTKTVHIIVPIVGSTNDVLARLVAPKLQEALGQSVIVENKGGAGGNIGADYVAKAAPDGHTLLVGYNGPLAVNVTLFKHMPYDPRTDLTPLTLAVTAPQYLAVHPSLGVNNIREFVAKAKANPGKLAYASVAVGSASHLTMEMFKDAAGIDLVHVPYKGAAPAVADLVGGQVSAAFMVPGNVQQFAKEGRLKLIASSGEKRFASTPDVPTLVESGYPEMIATSWIGFLAPKGTPKPIVDRYSRELRRILSLPDVKKQLRDMEFDVVASTPAQFSSWINSEIQKWGKVIKSTGATVD